jgi:hypothetical protein
MSILPRPLGFVCHVHAGGTLDQAGSDGAGIFILEKMKTERAPKKKKKKKRDKQ